MRYRQIHLDFHTSEKIKGIGEKFSKEQFRKALKAGHVDSITVFSKCHHGWAYHPSKANEMHPGLKFDLLKSEIEAAHEIGVKTPVYLSAGYDEKMARRHPEWIIRSKDESMWPTENFAQPGYHRLCFNSPYLEYLLKQIEEVCENYDADGIFLDIVGVMPCYCQNCVRTLLSEGKDPYDEKNALELAERVYKNYTESARKAADKFKPGIPMFHNASHISHGRRDLARMNTHLELESLPTGGWGYDHFPLSAAYARTLDTEFLGMTGKFHKSWGEFGGYKHPNALRFETALSVANGAKCSVGDQMHPNGIMDMATYNTIGKAYAEIEEKEPWLKNAVNVADIAVFTNESAANYYAGKGIGFGQKELVSSGDVGCTRILLEGKYLFNAVDIEEDFSKYKLVVLPDFIRVDEELREKLDTYMKNGGKLLLSGISGLCKDRDEFALDLGINYIGKCEFNPTYLIPNFDVSPLENAAYAVYTEAQKIENVSAEEIAVRENPYFNRTTFEFSSHQHAPNNDDVREPGIAITENTAYIAWNIFEDYAENGSLILKKVVCGVIDKLLKNKTVKTNLPAQGVITLTKQNNRQIVHLLYASPVKRGKNVEIIEDIMPVYNVDVEVRCEKKAERVYLVPQNRDIKFEQNENVISFTVDRMENHQMVVIE